MRALDAAHDAIQDLQETQVAPAARNAMIHLSAHIARQIAKRALTCNARLADISDAFRAALRQACSETRAEYERDAVLVRTFRHRGLPKQACVHWIASRDAQVECYFINSDGDVEGHNDDDTESEQS